MNREEATKRIQGLVYCLRNSLREEQKEALDIAIKALQAKTDDDLISRKDALEQIAQAECGLHYEDCKADNCTCDYIWRIRNIPSADRPTAKWNFIGDNLFECTYCGVAYTPEQLKSVTIYKDQFAPYYCPICGADMRGETE